MSSLPQMGIIFCDVKKKKTLSKDLSSGLKGHINFSVHKLWRVVDKIYVVICEEMKKQQETILNIEKINSRDNHISRFPRDCSTGLIISMLPSN